jgi:hypothetical protein
MVEGYPSTPYTCSCVATVDAPAAQVRKASENWARDLRWHMKRRKKGDSLVFRFYRGIVPLDWRIFSPEMTVTTSEATSKTEVTFCLQVFSRICTPLEGGQRICEAFARGVCSDLASRGAVVVPAELSAPMPNRMQLTRVATWWFRSQTILLTAALMLALAYGLSWAIHRDGGIAPFGAFALLVFSQVSGVDAVRDRSLGNPAAIHLVLWIMSSVLFAVLVAISFL